MHQLKCSADQKGKDNEYKGLKLRKNIISVCLAILFVGHANTRNRMTLLTIISLACVLHRLKGIGV